jgi:hypothetical protein
MPEVKNATVRLVLSLHEPRFYRQQGRNRLGRLLIKLGFVPAYPNEEEIGSVWVVLGNSTDDYETEGIEVTDPLPGTTARRVLERLRLAFESLGFTVVTETDYP